MEYLQENLPTKTNFDLNQIKSPGKSQKIYHQILPHGQRSGRRFAAIRGKSWKTSGNLGQISLIEICSSRILDTI